MSHINQLLTTSLVNSISQDSFVKDQDFYLTTKTKTPGLKTNTKTLFFVFEAPRVWDQDCGLEDYITVGNHHYTQCCQYLRFEIESIIQALCSE